MKINKYYLTSNEIIEIVNELVKQETEIARHIVLYGMVAQCVCDLSDVHWENCNDLYDEIVKQGIYDDFYDIVNFVDIREIVKEEIGVSSTIREFTTSLGNRLSDVKLDELTENLKAMKDDMK